MVNEKTVLLMLTEEFFAEEVTLEGLYKSKGEIDGYLMEYENEEDRRVSVEAAAEWIVKNYTGNYWNEEERLKEKIYMVYLMGINIAEIARLFDISRPTVYKKIRQFEESELFAGISKVPDKTP